MKTLQTPYLKVDTKNGTAYGGNQAWLPYKFLKGMGCGLISAADVIFHLEGKENVTEEEYVAFAKRLWKLNTVKFSLTVNVDFPFQRLESRPPLANLDTKLERIRRFAIS